MSRSVLVVGASRGLGAAIGRAFAAVGDRVVLGARSMDAAPLPAETGSVGTRLDIRSRDSCDAAVRLASERHGGLDVVVYNVGVSGAARFAATTEQTWSETFDVNVMGAVRILQAALPALTMSTRDAHVVLVGSSASLRGFANVAPYVASKHALLGLARAVAAETPSVTVDCVCPEYIATEMVDTALAGMTARGLGHDEALRRLLGEQSRLLRPEEVAQQVLAACDSTAPGPTARVLEVTASGLDRASEQRE